MTPEGAHSETQGKAARLREYSRGAQLIFENAESLFKEADVLRQAGFVTRAAFLHQISMEECAKVDMLGDWATTLLMDSDVDDEKIARLFRDHKVKNKANAYMASVTDEEHGARKRGTGRRQPKPSGNSRRSFTPKRTPPRTRRCTLTSRLESLFHRRT